MNLLKHIFYYYTVNKPISQIESYLISNGELNKEELSRLIAKSKSFNEKEYAELRAKALNIYEEVINKYGSLLKNNENMPVDQKNYLIK